MLMYDVKKGAELYDLTNREFNPSRLPAEWEKAQEAPIACYVWADENGYRPEAYAKMLFDEGDLLVLMYAREDKIQAKETRIGGGVCVDSCLECFVNPFPAYSDVYLNVEVNPAGVFHLGVGPGRTPPRKVYGSAPERFNLTVSRHANGWWAVSYRISRELIAAEYAGRALEHGCEMRANFYKCDESVHPHFGSWNPVEAPQPDFHRPECFGTLCVE